jgi:protein-histidine pros-kinase
MVQKKTIIAACPAGFIAILTGILVLIGWYFNNYQLQTFGLGGVTMKVNTALSFLFSGLALVFLHKKNQEIWLYLARIFSFFTFFLGALVFSQYLFNTNLGIDELLFNDVANAIKTVDPGRMAPNTALNFILVGLTLFFISFDKTKNSILTVISLALVFCISTFGLIGYVFGLIGLTGLSVYTSMAVDTSIVFIILSIGIWLGIQKDAAIIKSLERKLIAGITIVIAVILMVSINSIKSINSLLVVSNSVEHTVKVESKLSEIMSDVYEIAANGRGFVISNNDAYLKMWEKSRINILKNESDLGELIHDRPKQYQLYLRLKKLISERIDYSKNLILVAKTKGNKAALDLFTQESDSLLTNKIKKLIKQLDIEESRLLIVRNNDQSKKAGNSLTIIWMSIFVQITLFAAFLVFVTKDIIGRKKAQQELLDLNENLEEKIEERATELKSTHQKIIIERDKANQYFDVAGVIFVLLDRDGKIIKTNRKTCEVLGYQKNELIGIDWFSSVLPENIIDKAFGSFQAIMKGETEVLQFYENHIITKYGEERIIEWYNVLIYGDDGKPTGILSSGEDITERKAATEELRKANRGYAMLMNVNKAIVRATDKQTLFDKICRIAIDEGKFRMANIGMVDVQTNKFLPLASAGDSVEYVNILNIDLNDAVLSNGPTGIAIKTGLHKLANDIANDPKMVPWRENALRQGYKSSAAFPIKAFGETIGAFMLYSEDTYFFDETEVKLLDELAKDISFAIEFIDTNKKRLQAEEEIRNLNAELENKIEERTVELGKTNNNLLKEIDERKQVEDRFKFVVESAPNAIVLADSSGVITLVNKQTENYFGYNREEIIGKKIELLVPNAIKMGHSNLRSVFISDPTARKMGENRDLFGLKKDGTKIPVEVGLNPISINNKIMILASIIDITERKKAIEEIKNAKTEAERANHEKSEFLSRMSHELRTPLNSILGFAQLMNMGKLSPTHKKGVDHILNSGKNLLNLINEVLNLSRIEAGELLLSIEPVSLKSIILETFDVVYPLAQESNIILKWDNSEEEQIFVEADQQKLKQVMLNLINNAIKYNNKGGLVTVKAVAIQNEKVRISITDTGIGIAKKEMHKLFTAFQRIGPQFSDIEGTGLGLAVSKKLVEAMDGTIGIDDEVNKGSSFWIELPQAEGQLEGNQLDVVFETMPSTISTKAGTLLYVEDNISNQELVKQILDMYRPAIRLVTSLYGKDTVKMTLDYKPNVILLDLNLPDINGVKVIKLLQKEPQTKEIPVIVLSADALEIQIEKLLKAGAKNYITKPIDVQEFLKIIDGIMNND